VISGARRAVDVGDAAVAAFESPEGGERDMTSTSDRSDRASGVVVGIDGSASSKEALAWAARQAALTGDPLTVVMTWSVPVNYGNAPGWPSNFEPAADAKAALEACVLEVLGPHPRVTVTAKVVEGRPSDVLVEQSKTAALLVVGSRGHGEIAGMLLGSVSEFVTTHAHCPVVIMR
jgi:nucleotide-binding universal stress UspA family protein